MRRTLGEQHRLLMSCGLRTRRTVLVADAERRAREALGERFDSVDVLEASAGYVRGLGIEFGASTRDNPLVADAERRAAAARA